MEIKQDYVGEILKGEAKLWHIWNPEYSDDYNYGGYMWSVDRPTPEQIEQLYLREYGNADLARSIAKDHDYFIEAVVVARI